MSGICFKFCRWGIFALSSSLYWFKSSVLVLSILLCYAALSHDWDTEQGSISYCVIEECAITPLTEVPNLLLPNWEFKLFLWWIFMDVFYMCISFFLIYLFEGENGRKGNSYIYTCHSDDLRFTSYVPLSSRITRGPNKYHLKAWKCLTVFQKVW